MTLTKIEIKSAIKIITMTFAAMFIISISDNAYIHVLAFGVACFIPITIVKFDVFHPYCWFSALFWLYSTSYSMLHIIGYSIYGYDKVILQYELVTLLVILLVVSPRQYIYEKEQVTKQLKVNAGALNKVVYSLLAVMLIIAAVYIKKAGFTHKSQIYDSAGLLMTFVFRIPLILSILFPFLIVESHNEQGRLPSREIIIGTIAILFITIFSGERDFLFRFMLVMALLLYYLSYIKKIHFLILIPISIISFAMSAIYKYFFLSGNTTSKMDYGFIYTFLTSDFNSASQNLQYLVARTDTKGAMGVQRLLYDLSTLVTSNVPSLTAWYNKTFFPNSSSGKGFSLVGEGYVIGGMWGCITVGFITGFVIKIFYKNSQKNIWYFTSYLYFIALMIYSIRGDMSTIFSGIIKQILPVEFVIYILMEISNKNNAKTYSINRNRWINGDNTNEGN